MAGITKLRDVSVAHRKSRRRNILGDAAAAIAEAPRQRVGSPHDVLIEEARAPDLTGHKGCSEDSDEEPQGNQSLGRGD